MATNRFTANALAVAQVSNLTPAAPIPNDTFVVTINGKSVQYQTVPGTVADAVAGLQALLVASAIAEFLEAVWTASGSAFVVGTAATAGVPFTPVLSVIKASILPPVQSGPALAAGGSLVSGTPYFWVVTATNAAGETTRSNEVTLTPSGGNLTGNLGWAAVTGATGYKVYRTTTTGTYGASTLVATLGAVTTYSDTGTAPGAGTPPGSNTALSPATFTLTTPTASAGPSHVDAAGNWSLGALPVNGDDAYFENLSTPVLYGLSALSGVTLNSLNVSASFAGTIGLPDVNQTGNYWEYRPKYLAVSATTVNVGNGIGPGSTRVKLNVGNVLATVNVFATAAAAEQGLEALLFLGTNAGNVLNAYQGSVGVAVEAGSAATFTEVRIGYTQSVQSDVSLRVGAGATLTQVDQSGGTLNVYCALPTLNKKDGTTTLFGSGAAGTWQLDGGTTYYRSSGTFTSIDVGEAVLDFSQDLRPRTGTLCTLKPGATLLDPYKTVAWAAAPNGLKLNRCSLKEVTVDVGTHLTLTPSAY